MKQDIPALIDSHLSGVISALAVLQDQLVLGEVSKIEETLALLKKGEEGIKDLTGLYLLNLVSKGMTQHALGHRLNLTDGAISTRLTNVKKKLIWKPRK